MGILVNKQKLIIAVVVIFVFWMWPNSEVRLGPGLKANLDPIQTEVESNIDLTMGEYQIIRQYGYDSSYKRCRKQA